MSYRESENYLAIPTGEMIKELITDNGIDEKTVRKILELDDYDYYDLLEGDFPVTESLAEKLGVIFNCPASVFMNWETEYRKNLYKVNQENAMLVLDPA